MADVERAPEDLSRYPLIADQTADTLYAVACFLDVLQAVGTDELSARGRLGLRLAIEAAQNALLFEAERQRD